MWGGQSWLQPPFRRLFDFARESTHFVDTTKIFSHDPARSRRAILWGRLLGLPSGSGGLLIRPPLAPRNLHGRSRERLHRLRLAAMPDGLRAGALRVRRIVHAPEEPAESRLQPGLAAPQQMRQMGPKPTAPITVIRETP
jgi:hypothetical protein